MKKAIKKLRESPINYFSDLFICAIVVIWIAGIILLAIAAWRAMSLYADTSIWCYVADLVSTPIAAGAGMWMVKNAVQHAISNYKGKEVPPDFARVDVEEIESEEAEGIEHEETEMSETEADKDEAVG